MSTSNDPIEALDAADQRLDDAIDAVEDFGEQRLQQLADAYEEFTDILSRYEEPATGDGDFQTFIEFQGRIENFVERLPEDVLLRETFEECDDHLQQRRLSESDFEHVREQLEPVSDLAGRISERHDARDAYKRARKGVRTRLHEVRERIDDLDRLKRLGDADLDAPTERLQEPIETYDEAVTDAFREFKRNSPAREVLGFVESTDAFPLVNVATPPSDLTEFVESFDAGEEPIPRLLDLSEYSRSKLDHYVENPTALKQSVTTQQTYLRRLDGEPLTIGWPPPDADVLRWRCQELTAVVNRFAPEVVEHLRTVKRLPYETDYDRIRDSAVAETELTDEERQRLKSGAVEDELRDLREERERLEQALEAYPKR